MSSVTPEFGEEGTMATQEGVVQQEVGIARPSQSEEAGEMAERAQAEREAVYLDAEENELHAPGKTCGRCGQLIAANQDVRRRVDGSWMHEVCPPRTAGPPTGQS